MGGYQTLKVVWCQSDFDRSIKYTFKMGKGEGWGEGEGEGNGAAEAGQWENGLCGCFSSCRNCLCGYFCPCCLKCKKIGQKSVSSLPVVLFDALHPNPDYSR